MAHWPPLVWAYLARRLNEHFGAGTASYVEVRDRLTHAEVEAWLAWFETTDARTKATKRRPRG